MKERKLDERLSEGLFDMMKEFVTHNYIQSSSQDREIGYDQEDGDVSDSHRQRTEE